MNLFERLLQIADALEREEVEYILIGGFAVTNESIIVWTSETKSLLASLYKREVIPLFDKEGLGEIL